jgi:ABC-type transport system involved in cytochrome c biogenesis ATPase subunit
VATLSDLIGGIKARQSEIAVSLAAGNAVTWESYQRMVGHHAGLKEALDILENLMKEDDE